jgi:hypothetical protein
LFVSEFAVMVREVAVGSVPVPGAAVGACNLSNAAAMSSTCQ